MGKTYNKDITETMSENPNKTEKSQGSSQGNLLGNSSDSIQSDPLENPPASSPGKSKDNLSGKPQSKVKRKGEDFRTWEETLELLKTEYMLSLRNICQIMKASREWVNQYISPNVRKIYLDNGYSVNGKTKVSWTQMASLFLNDPKYIKDSIWINEQDFEELIERNIVSCTRQTIRIPVEMLVEEERYDDFIDEYNNLDAAYQIAQAEVGQASILGYSAVFRKCQQAKRRRDNCFREYLSLKGKRLLLSEVNITKRKEVFPVEVPLPDDYIQHWKAPHDLKDYGDVAENIYRMFFRDGYTRIEISFPATETFDDTNDTEENGDFDISEPHTVETDISNPDTSEPQPLDFETTSPARQKTKIRRKPGKKIYYVPEQVFLLAKDIEQYVTVAYEAWKEIEEEFTGGEGGKVGKDGREVERW